MEGKNVIMPTLLLSLLLAQIQVDAKTNCPTTTARNCYNVCRLPGNSRQSCANLCGCTITFGNEYHGILENTDDNTVNEYCKLGCASSVCGAITTLQNSDASEVVNGAIEKCTKACSAFCTKGSISTA